MEVGNFPQFLQLRRDVLVVLTCDDGRREKRGYGNDFEGLLSLFAFFLESRDDSLFELSERFGYFADLLFKLF